MTTTMDIEILTIGRGRQFTKAVSKYRMQPGYFIVRKLQLAETTKGGIVLPESVRKKSVGNLVSIQAKILNAPAKGRDGKDSPVRAGDTIIYNSYNVGKLTVQVDGQMVELPVIREMDIDAVIRG